jgi:predicted CopG family antitoxin
MRVYKGEKLIKKTIYIEDADYKIYEEYMKLKNFSFGQVIRTLMTQGMESTKKNTDRLKQQPSQIQKPVDDNPFDNF